MVAISGMDVYDFVKRSMSRLLTNLFAAEYSWQGARSKAAFKDLFIAKLIIGKRSFIIIKCSLQRCKVYITYFACNVEASKKETCWHRNQQKLISKNFIDQGLRFHIGFSEFKINISNLLYITIIIQSEIALGCGSSSWETNKRRGKSGTCSNWHSTLQFFHEPFLAANIC